MAVQRTVLTPVGRVVAVIADREDFRRARRLRRAPDLFELRLDAFADEPEVILGELKTLSVPLIITARDPAEGGANALSIARRRDMLLRFLPRASYVDVELRSVVKLEPVLQAAQSCKIPRIISVHDFRRTPSTRRLHELARAAEAIGPDVLKIATRTDTARELARLIEFFDWAEPRMPVSAMGLGKLGRVSRRLLALRGSALNYVHLGNRQVDGQLSLRELRRVLAPVILTHRHARS